MRALMYVNYSHWNNYSSTLLLDIWMADHWLTFLTVKGDMPIMLERNSVLSPSSALCWFTLCWLSCDEIGRNWYKEGLLSHSIYILTHSAVVSWLPFRRCSFILAVWKLNILMEREIWKVDYASGSLVCPFLASSINVFHHFIFFSFCLSDRMKNTFKSQLIEKCIFF